MTTSVFSCKDPETGEWRPLDSFPIVDLGGGWSRRGSWVFADYGAIELGIVRPVPAKAAHRRRFAR